MSVADDALIRMLNGFETRVRRLAVALAHAHAHACATVDEHESDGVARRLADDSGVLAIRVAAARRIWFSTPVPLDAFLQPGNRIAILAPDVLRRVLSARALLRCQDSIRRCIDREQRRALASAVGEATLSRLQGQSMTSPLAEPLPGDLHVDALAQRGWALLSGDGAVCVNATLANIVTLSLAHAAGGQAWDVAMLAGRAATCHKAGVERENDVSPLTNPDERAWNARGADDDTRRFFSIAGDLFPEFQWLFG